MAIFMTLWLGHLLGDFPLQSGRIYLWKRANVWGVLFHVTIHVVITAMLFKNVAVVLPYFLGLGILHFFTDWVKNHHQLGTPAFRFWVDQVVHFGGVYLIYSVGKDVLMPALPSIYMPSLIMLAMLPGAILFTWLLTRDIAVIYKEKWDCEPLVVSHVIHSFYLANRLVGVLVVGIVWVLLAKYAGIQAIPLLLIACFAWLLPAPIEGRKSPTTNITESSRPGLSYKTH